ncbi:MAG: hypothetical protein JWN41_1250 [Thermoleophilia bacterium]|nr:hypothetical protein [Thermoleophilia bacterium]
MNEHHHHDASSSVLDDEARHVVLRRHLAQLVRRGGTVEEQHDARAVVIVPRRPSYLPAIGLAAAGLGLFLTVGGALFLVAALAALLGWHKKLVAGVHLARILVRIDELGHVSEMELDRSQVA